MKTIKNTDQKIVFTLDINESLANAIRRSVSLIPTMAIDELEIAKNDSALYDETIAHRMGLIPIKMEKSWKEKDILKFKLNIKKAGMVYSGDMKGEAEVVYDKIPITLLDEDQEIKISAKTKMGTGQEHSKFLPGILFYRNISGIVMDKEFEDKIKKTFPENEINNKGNKIIIKDNKEKSILDFCEGLAKKSKKEIEVKDEKEILVIVESFGQMKAEEIFKKAIEALEKELKSIKIK